MKVVIDTSSLLSLVRYYLPFDNDDYLFNFFKGKIEKGEVIIIDKVYEECNYTAKGLVLKQLHFLTDKNFQKNANFPHKTDSIVAPSPAKFLRMVENQFAIGVQRNKLSDIEFEIQKNIFLESADIRQIILCMLLINKGYKVVLVSEETAERNDNKLFIKIPAMCKQLEIPTMTLPELIKHLQEINFNFS